MKTSKLKSFERRLSIVLFCFLFIFQSAFSKSLFVDSLKIVKIEIYSQSKDFRYSTDFLPPYIYLTEVCNSEEYDQWPINKEVITSKQRINEFKYVFSNLKKPPFFVRLFNRKFKKKGKMYYSYVCIKIKYEGHSEAIILFTEKKKKIILVDDELKVLNVEFLNFSLLNSPDKIKRDLSSFYSY